MNQGKVYWMGELNLKTAQLHAALIKLGAVLTDELRLRAAVEWLKSMIEKFAVLGEEPGVSIEP